MIEANLSALKQTKLHQYVIRFLLGGVCTVIAGLVAKRFGPVIGGLFLAFPAIFPASASLIEAHEKENKKKLGADGTIRGRLAASYGCHRCGLGVCRVGRLCRHNMEAIAAAQCDGRNFVGQRRLARNRSLPLECQATSSL